MTKCVAGISRVFEVAVVSAVLIAPCSAAPVTWVGPNNGFWDTAGNWNPGLPGAADDALLGAFDTEFRSGAVTIRSLAGTGRFTLSGGTLTITNASTSGALALSGGTLGGTGVVTLSGPSTWTGGTMTGTGAAVFNDALAISGNTFRSMTLGRTLTTNGTTTWTNAVGANQGLIQVSGGSTINNTGTWLDQQAVVNSISNAGGTNNFNNSGTYTKSGSTTTSIDIAFNNTSSGIVNVNAGTLSLGGGGTSNGTFNVAAGATLDFGGGTHNLSGTFAGAGTGQMQVSAGTVNATGTNAFGGQLAVNGSGTLNVGGAFSALGLNVTAGTLGGTGVVTLSGPSTWTGGTMTGTGAAVFNDALAISGNTFRSMTLGRTLTTNGTTTWTNAVGANQGLIQVSGGSTINNTGTWLDQQAVVNSISNAGGTNNFNNSGTYTKSGSTTTSIDIAFNNTSSGIVNVNAGTLSLGGGGTSNGTFNVAAGATLDFGGGTHNLSGTFAGAGTGQMQVSAGTVNATGTNAFGGQLAVNGSGTLNVGGAFSALGLNVTAGTLGGTGVVTLSGPSTWTGGTMTGTGAAVFNDALAISGNTFRSMTLGRTLTTNGTTTWTNAVGANQGLIQVSGGSTINNTGTWLDQQAVVNSISNAGGTNNFNNSGTYTKSGSTTTSIDIAFNNTSSGIVNVNAGTLSLGGGGTSNGTFNVAAGATLDFGGGTHNLSGTFAGAGTGQMQVSAGTVNATGTNAFGGQLAVNGSGTLNVGGAFSALGLNVTAGTLGGTGVVTLSGPSTWTGGTMTGTGAAVFNDALAISGNTFRSMTLGRTLTTNGTTTWTNAVGANQGLIQLSGGSTINNTGTWLDQQAFTNSIGNVGGTNNFNNSGTYTKTGSAAVTIDIGFSNTGTLDVQAGHLTLNDLAGLQGNGTLRISGPGMVTISSGNNAVSVLDHQGGAGSLIVGTRTTTVSADYNNANFGTGNAFDRRANITTSGTGNRIIASGSTNQGISGSLVTNGTGTTPTLTIGNVHVGATTLGYSIVNTGSAGPSLRGAIQTSVNGASLTDARLSGNGVTAGNWGPVATAAALGRDVTITINSAGVYTPLAGQSVNILNNFDNTRSQLVAINSSAGAAAYNLASAGVTPPSPVAVANQRVGGVATAALTITNSAPSGAFTEGLDASFGAATGAVHTNSGSISLLAGGTSNGSAMTVGVDASTAGAKSGNVTVNLASNGLGTSGLGITALTPQTIAVSGNVYGVAAGQVNTASLNFGTVQVGQSVSQVLNIANIATGPAGFVEDLNARFGASSGQGAAQIVGTGSVSGLAAGANSNAMTVSVNTGAAGTINGAIGVNFFSAGTVNGTSNGLGELAVGSSSYGVVGTIQSGGQVVDQAHPVLNTTAINLGNVRVGAVVPTQAVSVTNQATGNPQAALSASISAPSPLTAAGSFNLLAPGATDNSSLAVGMNTATAGSRNGTATVSFVSDASNVGNCAPNCQLTLASQNVNVTGGVYRTASGQLNTANLTFGTVQVGQAVSQVLNISNIATGASGFVEDLNARFGATSGQGAGLISGSGSISGLAAGSANGSAMTVSVNTAAAGTINGAIGVNFFSAGTVNGTSNGLGELAVGSSSYGVVGTIQSGGQVVDQAHPVLNTTAINLGNVRVGAVVPTQTVSVTNQATGNPQAALSASISAPSPLTAAGSFNLLAPGASDNSSLVVGMNTATAGSRNGSATVAFVSDASNVGNCAPNCQLTLASQDVNVTGAVYRLASPTLNTTSVDLAARVGDAAPSRSIGITNTSPDVFTERLNASVTSTPAGFASSGSVTGLAAGASSTNLAVSLNTATAGSVAGQVAIGFVSSGVGTTGAPDASVGTQNVALTGRVYAPAVKQLDTPSVDFGIVHRGDVVTMRGVGVTNAAAVTALNDTLSASISGGASPFAANGTVSGLGAGASNASAMTVSLNTASAGVFSGNAVVSFASHDADLADASLGTSNVALLAQVNNYAQAGLAKTSGAGTFSSLGNDYTIDFGILVQGAGPLASTLQLSNAAIGPADLLSGVFDLSGFHRGQNFALTGFGPFANLAAGGVLSDLGITFSSGVLGQFDELITLHSSGSNPSGFDEALADVHLHLVGDVAVTAAVPEPETYVLMLAGLAALGAVTRRRRTAGAVRVH